MNPSSRNSQSDTDTAGAFKEGPSFRVWLCHHSLAVLSQLDDSNWGSDNQDWSWMVQAELIQLPVTLNRETCSPDLPSCSKSPPQLYLYWSDHAVRWNRKATKKPHLLPTDSCHRNCWSLWYAAFHGHSHLPRDLCGSWESGGWSRSNGPAGHGGLQGRLQERER